MALLDDVDLDRTPGATPPSQVSRSSRGRGVVIVLVAAGALVALLLVNHWPWTKGATAPRTAHAPTSVDSAPTVLGRDGAAIPLPELNDLDPALRDLIAPLSRTSVMSKWLEGTNLARELVTVADAVGRGNLPFSRLSRLRPAQPFTVQQENGRTAIDARSYARYDAVADAIVALDPLACSRVYATLKPRLEQAYAELGQPERTLDQAVEQAIISLLQTPIPSTPVAVVPKGGLYAYADPKLEALAPAQKLLLRTGPDNARRIQAQVRELAGALGVPEERLPPEHRGT
jgi:hypothetical protein